MVSDPIDTDLDSRKTGGAGARTHPLTDGEYMRQERKLMALLGADDDQDHD